MSEINKKLLCVIGAGLISAPASAGVISFNETQSLDELLNSQNPQLQGAFDLSAVLAQVSNNNEEITGIEAMISAYGYSDVENNYETTDYSPYEVTSTVNRNTSYSYSYSYSCGWSTCRGYSYVNRTATDRNYDRDVVTSIEDQIADEMSLVVAGTGYTDVVELFESTVDGVRQQTSQSGYWSSGYNRYYDNHSTEYSQFFGDLALEIDVSTMLMDELNTNNGLLDWTVDASVGQFNLYDISLDITFTTAKNLVQDSVSVPEPTSIALLGLGLAGIGLRRRNKANKAD